MSAAESDPSQQGSQEEKSPGTPDVCLKCSRIIEHVPYRFLKQTFHAVCVKCDFCGRKLLAKPFITEGSKIFCGDKCNKSYKNSPTVSLIVSPPAEQAKEQNNKEETEGESLLEVLENIQEGNEELLKLSKKPSPLQKCYDPDRRTDYPRARSPEQHSPSSPNWSRRSSLSLSAMSESSITSDGSSVVSFDANKQPKKKILKHPHRVRKSSKNRVRWNLPNEDDTASLQSFDSTMSTNSEIYSRGRLAMMERKWQLEAQQNLALHLKNTTGHYTPSLPHHKNLQPPLQSYTSSSLLNVSPSSTASNSPSRHFLLGGSHEGSSVVPQRAFSASSLPQIASNLDGSKEYLKAAQCSISPLTSSSTTSSSGSGSSPRRMLQSTPKTHFQSDGFLARSSRRSTPRSASNKSDAPHSFDIDMPVLKLDNSNLTDLEESTLEDRKRMHIFEFPQQEDSPRANVQTAGPHLLGLQRSNRAPAAVASAFLDESDENDYDHLSPLDDPIPSPLSSQNEDAATTQKLDRNSDSIDRVGKDLKVASLYSNKDIEDALEVINNESGQVDSAHAAPEVLPPPLPVRETPEVLQPLHMHDPSTTSKFSAEMPPPLHTHDPNVAPESAAESQQDEGSREDEDDYIPAVFEDIGELNWQFSQASPNQESASANGRSSQGSASASLSGGSQGSQDTSSSSNKKLQEHHLTTHDAAIKEEGVKPDLVNNEPHQEEAREVSKTAHSHRQTEKGDDMVTLKPAVTIGNAIRVQGKVRINTAIRSKNIVKAVVTIEEGDTTDKFPETPSLSKMSREEQKDKIPPQVSSKPLHVVNPLQVSPKPPRNPKTPPQVLPKPPRNKAPTQTSPEPLRGASTSKLPSEKPLNKTLQNKIPSRLSPKEPHADRKESPKESRKIPPPVAPKPLRDAGKAKPPPVPPKTKSIKRGDRDVNGNPKPLLEKVSLLVEESLPPAMYGEFPSPMDDREEEDASHVEDILPPPPEFAFCPPTNLPDPHQNASASFSADLPGSYDELLASTSNSTLVPDPEESPERLVLETDLRESSSSSSSPQSHWQNKHSWSMIHHSKVRERIGSQPKCVEEVLPSILKNSDRTTDIGSISLQTASISRSTSVISQLTDKESNPLALRRVPNHHPTPPPPIPAHMVKVRDQLSSEEQNLLPLLYPSSGKPQLMKPVIHDTDSYIQKMLTEIDSESESRSRRVNTASYGTCGKCARAIQRRQELIQYGDMSYHSLCFQCATCHVPLQGRMLHKVKAALLCQECLKKNESAVIPRSPSGNNHRNYQIPTTSLKSLNNTQSSSSTHASSAHGSAHLHGKVTTV